MLQSVMSAQHETVTATSAQEQQQLVLLVNQLYQSYICLRESVHDHQVTLHHLVEVLETNAQVLARPVAQLLQTEPRASVDTILMEPLVSQAEDLERLRSVESVIHDKVAVLSVQLIEQHAPRDHLLYFFTIARA